MSGHGKTVGVPDIDLASGAAAGIRKWLQAQQAKLAARRDAIAAARQAARDRHATITASPLTITLRSTARLAAVVCSPTSLDTAPTPIHAHFSPLHAIFSQSPIDLMVPTTHNTLVASKLSIVARSRVIFIDIARIRRQDAALLDSLLLNAIMED